MPLPSATRLLMVLSFAFIAGCGGTTSHSGMEKRDVVPAQGIVTYKGKALAEASVSFVSLDNKIRGGGKTDGVGSFTISTYGQNDGIPPGKYKVTVAVSGVKEIEPGVLAPEPEGGFKSPIPAKYANPQTTDILMEVTQSGPNDFKIELK